MRAATTEVGSRLLWFVALWLAGTAAVGAVAFLLRSVMRMTY